MRKILVFSLVLIFSIVGSAFAVTFEIADEPVELERTPAEGFFYPGNNVKIVYDLPKEVEIKDDNDNVLADDSLYEISWDVVAENENDTWLSWGINYSGQLVLTGVLPEYDADTHDFTLVATVVSPHSEINNLSKDFQAFCSITLAEETKTLIQSDDANFSSYVKAGDGVNLEVVNSDYLVTVGFPKTIFGVYNNTIESSDEVINLPDWLRARVTEKDSNDEITAVKLTYKRPLMEIEDGAAGTVTIPVKSKDENGEDTIVALRWNVAYNAPKASSGSSEEPFRITSANLDLTLRPSEASSNTITYTGTAPVSYDIADKSTSFDAAVSVDITSDDSAIYINLQALDDASADVYTATINFLDSNNKKLPDYVDIKVTIEEEADPELQRIMITGTKIIPVTAGGTAKTTTLTLSADSSISISEWTITNANNSSIDVSVTESDDKHAVISAIASADVPTGAYPVAVIAKDTTGLPISADLVISVTGVERAPDFKLASALNIDTSLKAGGKSQYYITYMGTYSGDVLSNQSTNFASSVTVKVTPDTSLKRLLVVVEASNSAVVGKHTAKLIFTGTDGKTDSINVTVTIDADGSTTPTPAANSFKIQGNKAITLRAGESAGTTLMISGNSSGDITWTLVDSKLPTGVSATLPTMTNESAELSVRAASTVSAGRSSITVRATDKSGKYADATVSITIDAGTTPRGKLVMSEPGVPTFSFRNEAVKANIASALGINFAQDETLRVPAYLAKTSSFIDRSEVSSTAKIIEWNRLVIMEEANCTYELGSISSNDLKEAGFKAGDSIYIIPQLVPTDTTASVSSSSSANNQFVLIDSNGNSITTIPEDYKVNVLAYIETPGAYSLAFSSEKVSTEPTPTTGSFRLLGNKAINVKAGESARTTLMISGNSSGDITWTLVDSKLPTGVSATLPTMTNESAELSVRAASTVSAGRSSITVRATDKSGKYADAPITVTITSGDASSDRTSSRPTISGDTAAPRGSYTVSTPRVSTFSFRNEAVKANIATALGINFAQDETLRVPAYLAKDSSFIDRSQVSSTAKIIEWDRLVIMEEANCVYELGSIASNDLKEAGFKAGDPIYIIPQLVSTATTSSTDFANMSVNAAATNEFAMVDSSGNDITTVPNDYGVNVLAYIETPGAYSLVFSSEKVTTETTASDDDDDNALGSSGAGCNAGIGSTMLLALALSKLIRRK